MVAGNPPSSHNRDDQIARLTEAAYLAVLEGGYRGSFLDLELSIWSAIQQSVNPESEASRRLAAAVGSGAAGQSRARSVLAE